MILYILPALAAAFLVNITKFFEIETVHFCTDYTACNCGVVSG